MFKCNVTAPAKTEQRELRTVKLISYEEKIYMHFGISDVEAVQISDEDRILVINFVKKYLQLAKNVSNIEVI